MTPSLVLLVSVAGGAGAAGRLLVDGYLRSAAGTRFPWGTVVINLTGSFLLGLVTGMAQGMLATPWSAVLGTGLLGGYTTFSTASFETVRLLQERRWAAAAGNAVAVWLLAVLVAFSGFVLGSAV